MVRHGSKPREQAKTRAKAKERDALVALSTVPQRTPVPKSSRSFYATKALQDVSASILILEIHAPHSCARTHTVQKQDNTIAIAKPP